MLRILLCLKKVVCGPKSRGGFTMLFAVLVSSLLLSVGISIFNLSIKQLSLSAAGRESQIAFYAADTGADCALFWDLKGSLNGNTFVFPTPSAPDNLGPIKCGASENVVLVSNSDANLSTTAFAFKPVSDSLSGACVEVLVKKYENGATIIESRGYNTGYDASVTPPDCSGSNPLKVERGVRFTY